MAWRKRLWRGLLLLIILAAVGFYVAYERWTDPALIRDMVLASLTDELPGADVRVDGAKLEFLGGVTINGLAISSRDDRDHGPVALMPEITLLPDKQELGRGKLVLRKVAIKQPRLTIVRRDDGSWNLAGLTDSHATPSAMPLIEVVQGTVVFIDTASRAEPLTLTGVDLTLFSSEDSWCRFQATGRSNLLGMVECQGRLNRGTGELSLTWHVPQAVLQPNLMERLAGYLPEAQKRCEVAGAVELNGEVNYHPDAKEPLSYVCHLRMEEGRFNHPKLPVALEKVHLVAHLEAGRLTVEHLDARAAGGIVQASGELNGFTDESDWHVEIKADQVTLERSVYPRLPPHTKEFCEDFQAHGMLSAQGEIRRQDGKLHARYVIRPQGMSILFDRFPYPVDKIAGTLTYSEDGSTPTMKANLTGNAAERMVRLTGDITGEGLRIDNPDRPAFDLEITGSNLPIDDKFFHAMKPYPGTLKVLKDLEPGGLANVLVQLRRDGSPAGEPRAPLQKYAKIKFHHGHLRYAAFPYPVEDVDGTFELFADESWRFFDAKGKHKGGEFTGTGQWRYVTSGHHLHIELNGKNTLLDEEMRKALDEDMDETWRLFDPAGRVNFKAEIDCLNGGKTEMDLRINALNCEMRPTCFPYPLTDVRGEFHYAKNFVTMDELRARHGMAELKLKHGEVTLRPKNGYKAVLKQLSADELTIDDELLRALPKLVRHAFAQVKPDRPIRLMLRELTLDDAGRDEKKYEWDGQVSVRNAKLQLGLEASDVTGLIALHGSHDGENLKCEGYVQFDNATVVTLPLKDLRSQIIIKDDILTLPGIKASLHDGEIYGPIRVHFGAAPEYHIDVRASRIDLETFARQSLDTNSHAKGRASGQLDLTGRGDDLTSLRGKGWFHVDDGARLYDVPLVVSLLSALSGHLPKNSAFQEAHAEVQIDGEQLKVTHAELLGDALCLKGQGKMRVDGRDLNLEMYGLLWGRTLPLLPPLIDRIPVEISKQLMCIRIVGALGDPKVQKEPVPILVEPIKELWRTMAGRRKKAADDVSTTPPKRLP